MTMSRSTEPPKSWQAHARVRLHAYGYYDDGVWQHRSNFNPFDDPRNHDTHVPLKPAGIFC